jgi:hypothetical protein
MKRAYGSKVEDREGTMTVEDLDDEASGLLGTLSSCMVGSWPLDPLPMMRFVMRETGDERSITKEIEALGICQWVTLNAI